MPRGINSPLPGTLARCPRPSLFTIFSVAVSLQNETRKAANIRTSPIHRPSCSDDATVRSFVDKKHDGLDKVRQTSPTCLDSAAFRSSPARSWRRPWASPSSLSSRQVSCSARGRGRGSSLRDCRMAVRDPIDSERRSLMGQSLVSAECDWFGRIWVRWTSGC